MPINHHDGVGLVVLLIVVWCVYVYVHPEVSLISFTQWLVLDMSSWVDTSHKPGNTSLSLSLSRIPHDIQTMHELWGVTTYRKANKYLSSACLMDLVAALPDDHEVKAELVATQERLLVTYDALAHQYHSEKMDNPNNSLVLG